MPESRRCPTCGAEIPADAPEGLCPKCLAGLVTDPSTHPSNSFSTVADAPQLEGPGTTIGRYRLLQQIGEGGMGVVYMAEQTEPVRRKIALKIIKLGMDTKEVIARFEAERQALAMMDHPNIAKVLDAGATDTGRPYFAMELVRGVPITNYCDKNKLSANERLALFIHVCNAVQHAHQKAIIHRDLKPTNVMVTLHDDRPVPKVIDFGIAKATNQRLTEKTLFTRFGQFVGTPTYMSPEQAAMSELDVDTRSDVYSLGALLYELLTGTTPFDAGQLRSAGYDEIRRIICEEEPLKPSTKLSSLAEGELTEVADRRHEEPGRLSRLVRGDLDWIVMKCLEKDRTRRYDTANGLANDLQRHLNNEPVAASPPSNFYRFRKLYRRHKKGITTWTLIVLALIVAVFTTSRLLLAENFYRTDSIKQAMLLAHTTAINLVNSLEFLDPDDADEVLESLSANPSILSAQVYDAKGEVFASYGAPLERPKPRLPAKERYAEVGSSLEVFVPIVNNGGTPIGTLQLRRELPKRTTRTVSISLRQTAPELYRTDSIRQTVSLAYIVGDSLAIGLMFQDHDDADEVFESLSANSSILSALLYDARGEVFASYGAPLERPMSRLPADEQFVEVGSSLEVFVPIMHRGARIGTVQLRRELPERPTGFASTFWRNSAQEFYRADSIRQTVWLSHIVGDYLITGLHYQDPDDARKVLKSLSADPSIVGAQLHDAQGKVYASYGAPVDLPTSGLPADEQVVEVGSSLEVFVPIMDDGTRIGTLHLRRELPNEVGH